ncbi:MAG: hypothetical protein M3069_04460, partial [Chloroflexota bacterium]|nr:hypothetical protein [Chloroflexota bacterium]
RNGARSPLQAEFTVTRWNVRGPETSRPYFDHPTILVAGFGEAGHLLAPQVQERGSWAFACHRPAGLRF